MNYKLLNIPESDGIVFPFRLIALMTISLPLFGFLFCIIWSLMFDFTLSTSTHCGVTNYLPSISAAIGNFTPQKYVWRTAIGLHSTPRYIIAVMYFWFKHRSSVLLIVHLTEISSLVGLTFISSSENFRKYKTELSVGYNQSEFLI